MQPERKISETGRSRKTLRAPALALILGATGFAFPAAAEDASGEPPGYSLVAVARYDGISYASLVDNRTREHFLLSTKNPARGLVLTQVTPDWDASGVSAVIRQNGESLLLQPGPDNTSLFNSPSNSPVPAAAQASSESPMAPRLKPPPGAALPLVFQPVDARALHLSPEQQEIIDRLRHDFISAVGETGTTSNAPAVPAWQRSERGTNLPNPSAATSSSKLAKRPGTERRDLQNAVWTPGL